MINGLPGSMATKVHEHVLANPQFFAIPYSLTGPEISKEGLYYELLKPWNREGMMNVLKKEHESVVAVDYTLPDAVEDNVDLYSRYRIPFVMGTTGGNRDALEARVQRSVIPAVIAPNMAMPIVALQKFIEDFAAENPGGLEGCTLKIVESHQASKKDTSGTAKAMIKYFKQLGIPYNIEQLHKNKIRGREDSLNFGVPEEHLSGHGYHTYALRGDSGHPGIVLLGQLYHDFLMNNAVFEGYDFGDDDDSETLKFYRTSPDATVFFSIESSGDGQVLNLTHNVDGRDVYALDTLEAVKFLQEQIDAGVKGKAFSMIDVLNWAADKQE